MLVKAKIIDSANALITAKADKKSVEQIEKKVTQNYARNAKIDGFRKGKVPPALIKQRFAEGIANDVKSQVAQDAMSEAMKELKNPTLLGTPFVSKFDEKDGEFDIEIKISTKPTVELGDYMALVPTHKKLTVTKKEVEDAMQSAADSTALPEEIKTKRACKNGDIVVFDFAGFVDGKPLENGSANDQELELGAGRFIPGFEDGMAGMKIGEEKALELTFPEEYHAKELSGKAVKFDVKLKAIKEKKKVELTDELAKQMLPNVENATLESFRSAVEESMINEKRVKLFYDELKPQLLEKLSKHYKFDLPQLIVDQEMDHLANQKASQMSKEDIEKLKDNQKEIEKLRESVRAEAEDRVKITILVDELAKAESVVVGDQEVMQTIYYEAYRSGQNPKDMLEYYEKNNLLSVIKMSLTEERVLNQLLEKKNADDTKEEKAEKKPAAKKTTKKDESEAVEEKPKKAPAKKPAAKKEAKEESK